MWEEKKRKNRSGKNGRKPANHCSERDLNMSALVSSAVNNLIPISKLTGGRETHMHTHRGLLTGKAGSRVLKPNKS